jgi:tRNA pseudouridine55 synthase
VNGILIVDKPPDFTSHDVVARVRRILGEKRIGHTGTLDPFATGILVVLVGRATRLAQFLGDADKEYEAIVRLGYSTDTGDRTGERLETTSSSELDLSEPKIEDAIRSLVGNILQVPPMYSAKKIGGKKLYELARRGETVEREPVGVCIHEFEPIKTDDRLIRNNLDGTFDLKVRVVCSTGTYIRTLAEDLGKRLFVGAHLAELRRTRVGNFALKSALTLDQLQTVVTDASISTALIPPAAALSQLPFVHLSSDDARKTRHGMEVTFSQSDWSEGDRVRMCDEAGNLIAVGEYDGKSQLCPRVVIATD